MYVGTIINNFLIFCIFGHRHIFKYSCSPYLFHEGAFCFAMGEWRSINGKLVYGGGGSALGNVILQGVLLFVTKCDEGGGGVKNQPESRYVIYVRLLNQ